VEDFPAVITTEIGRMVMLEFNNVMNLRGNSSDLSKTDKDKVMAQPTSR
jgi:hypothetical protein